MCGCGGGGSQTVVQTTQVPQFVQDYFKWQTGQQQDIYNRALNTVNNNPQYPTFPGERIQPFTSDQLAAMEAVRNQMGYQTDANGNLMSNGQNPLGWDQLQASAARNTSAADTYSDVGGQPFNPAQISTTSFPGQVGQYMSPYLSNVVDTTMNEINRQQDLQNQRNQDQAIQAGAFGGDRSAVLQAMNDRDFNQLKAQTTANLMNQGYGVAGQLYGQDAARQLAADQQNQNMGLLGFNANRDQFNTDQNRLMQSAQLAAGLASQQQQMGLQQSQAMMNIGNLGQAFGQEGLNQQYQDFINQRNWPYNQVGFLASTMKAQPFSPLGGTTTTEQPMPSQLPQTVAGLGTLGLGIGSLIAACSKGWKEGKAPVDYQKVLELMEQLPVELWRYKTDAVDGGATQHIGPYAEDFHALFGMGDGKTIQVIDAIGVLMASVKALAARVKELEGNG